MMCFKGASAAILSGALLIAVAHAATAQQPATPEPAIIRLPAGVLFRIPTGWGWSELSGRDLNFVRLDYDATRPQQGARQNVNEMALSVRSETSLPNYVRVDSERTEKLANGATLSWRMGLRFQPHYGYDAVVLLGSRHLNISVLDEPTPRFDKRLVQDAVRKIAGSMREVPQSNVVFHPNKRMAVDRPDRQRWGLATNPYNFQFACRVCGQGADFVMLISSGPPATVSAAIAAIAQNYNLKLGEARRESLPSGEVTWTEQSGSRYPFLGTIKQGDSYFLISINGGQNMVGSNDNLRNDFLAAARSVRAWDGR
jgi:hypothetical protein